MSLSRYLCTWGVFLGVGQDIVWILYRLYFGRALMPDGPGWFAAELIFKGVFFGVFMGIALWFTSERRRKKHA